MRLPLARNPLVGYEPLTDLSTPCGFLFRALGGGQTALDTAATSVHTGGRVGLPDLRIVGV